MSLFSGTRITDRDVDAQTQQRIRLLVQKLWEGRIGPDDAARQFIDLIGRSAHALARAQSREGAEDVTKQSAG